MTNSPIAIKISNLCKKYRIYRHPFDAFSEAITGKKKHVVNVALEDINLELRRGEIVGVLGRNGAGKSTLLKIIAGTLEHTEGQLSVNGRITAILELGTGFHPDYTGRENIYMGGLCLGMSRDEIDSKLEDIIDFSELKSVIDQPFKTYSTGMQARLTFSTAISIDPDILIIDEALSVGDAKFQMKCFTWMQKLREQNATILVVSHDTNTVTTLCDRALILEEGKVFAEGNSKKITNIYHNLLFSKKSDNDFLPKSDGDIYDLKPAVIEEMEVTSHSKENSDEDILRYGTGDAVLKDWGIYRENGDLIRLIESGSRFQMRMSLTVMKDISDMSCGFAIKDRRGTVLWGVTNLIHDKKPFNATAGQSLSITVFGVMWLATGDYFVTLGLAHADDGIKIDFVEDAIRFSVSGPENIFTTSTVNLQSSLYITSEE